ncbi:unnamed protein product [Ambrosiozyma monospora]|uniref:Unnamed protein product n=1 Tax=Ambrosiozyma monospora TaxID=43982 RepID=A0ACB5TYN6_AMBMO|nr:unnamed protein product [Ambrosiozyma monospora]
MSESHTQLEQLIMASHNTNHNLNSNENSISSNTNIVNTSGNTNNSPLLNTHSGSEDVPVWQPDEDATECPNCNREFTFFFRKHHCRKCGRIFCSDCASIFTTYLPNTYVVSPQSQIFLESPYVPHRTCYDCADELDMIRAALRENNTNQTIPSNHFTTSGQGGTDTNHQTLNIDTNNHLPNHSQRHSGNNLIKDLPYNTMTREVSGTSSVLNVGTSSDNNIMLPLNMTTSDSIATAALNNAHRRDLEAHDQDDENLCPVCGTDLRSFSTTNERESHVNECLLNLEFSGSPDTKRQSNRMLVYTIPWDTNPDSLNLNEDNECHGL